MTRLGLTGRVQGFGARFSFLFGPPAEKRTLQYQDLLDYAWPFFYSFCRACLRQGVYIHTMWHHGLSASHSDAEVDRALEGIESALRQMRSQGQWL